MNYNTHTLSIDVSNNDRDIELLYNEPYELVSSHQNTIRIIVNRFIRSGLFRPAELEEIVQYVNEKLLADKLPKMQQQYDRTYFVVTYLSRIVNNLCLEYARRNKTVPVGTVPLDHADPPVDPGTSADDSLLIRDECRNLEVILKMYGGNRARTLLYLKALYSVRTTHEDLSAVFPGISNEDIADMTNRYQAGSHTDKEIYELLTDLSNRYERKQITADATRKWIQAKITEIIGLLNGVPQESNHNKETLKILFQKYCESVPD